MKLKTLVAIDFIVKPSFMFKVRAFMQGRKVCYNAKYKRWCVKTKVVGHIKCDGWFYPNSIFWYKIYFPYGIS